MEQRSPYGEFTDKDFKELSDYIYDNYGINLYPNKKVLVKSRLIKRLNALGINSYKEYCKFVLHNDPERKEAVEMINRISTNKTEFFREDDHFHKLTNEILPDLLRSKETKNVSVWSAGCSSGEEPYTIAMVLSEFKSTYPGFNFKITASDISTQVLKKATKAVYPNSLIEQIPEVYRKKYLLKSKNPMMDVFRIGPDLRRHVEFFRYNLLNTSLPFSTKVNITFCRNTLIYFDRPTQKKVVTKLLETIHSNGYLILGHSESLINMDFNIEQISPSIYKKL